MRGPLTRQDLKIMRKAGKVASAILRKLKGFIKPGVSTKDIEAFFERELSKQPGMEAAFKGFMGYPASCCVSVNDEVIHGIPSPKVVKSGDLVSVDIGIKYQNLYVDTAYTYGVGSISPLAKKLIKTTRESLKCGICQVKSGKRIGDVSAAVQKSVEKSGFSVIKRFVGHGVGRDLHLPPEVPNFGSPGQGAELTEGYAIAIEPMVSSGDFDVDILGDGWTAKTKDGSLSAHFEHTVAITKKGPWILTK